MATVLLIIIYMIFISLGLPDSMLGSSFPAIADNIKAPIQFTSYISPITSICTILSSLCTPFLIKRFKEQYVISFSIMLTAIGLLIFSFARENTLYLLFISAVPLGLGAGAIDASINNYVALHYKAIHMNWLHCCWGVGASISPMIIGAFIDPSNNSKGWNIGILTVSIIQFVIMFISFISVPLWNRMKVKEDKKEEKKEDYKYVKLFKNPVFYLTVLAFFCYCGLETTMGLWTGSYLNYGKGFDTAQAASLSSFFFIGITVGRFISGPLSLKIKENNMIRIGEIIISISMVFMIISSVYQEEYTKSLALASIVICGLGCAPIYPAIIRLTPYRFSKAGSQKAMSLEVAIAYIGNLISPFIFGEIAKAINNYLILPYIIITFLSVMILCHEIINIRLKKRDSILNDEDKKKYLAEV